MFSNLSGFFKIVLFCLLTFSVACVIIVLQVFKYILVCILVAAVISYFLWLYIKYRLRKRK